MEKNKGFAFFENFWTSIEKLSVEQQKEVCYAIAKYGITGEMVDETEFPIGKALTQAFKMSIDKSVNKFNENSDNGTRGGRPVKVSDEELKEYIIANDVSAKEVAQHFGISESAVQKKEVWKNRKALREQSSVAANNCYFDF